MTARKTLHPELAVKQRKYKKVKRRKSGDSLDTESRNDEEWKKIEGTSGLFSVSNYGRVRRNYATSHKLLRTHTDANGVVIVHFLMPHPHAKLTPRSVGRKRYAGYSTRRVVKILVVRAFLPHLEGIVTYKDGDPSNLHVSNLMERKLTRKGGKLTARKVAYIKRLILSTDLTLTEIAERYGISPGLVSNIKNGRRWEEVKPSDFLRSEGIIRNAHKKGGHELLQLEDRFTLTDMCGADLSIGEGHWPWYSQGFQDELNRYVIACWHNPITSWSTLLLPGKSCNVCYARPSDKLTTMCTMLNANEKLSE